MGIEIDDFHSSHLVGGVHSYSNSERKCKYPNHPKPNPYFCSVFKLCSESDSNHKLNTSNGVAILIPIPIYFDADPIHEPTASLKYLASPCLN